jgi:hypothetical protein
MFVSFWSQPAVSGRDMGSSGLWAVPSRTQRSGTGAEAGVLGVQDVLVRRPGPFLSPRRAGARGPRTASRSEGAWGSG